MDRRFFLTGGLACASLLVTGGSRALVGASLVDPRLTARPRRPGREPETGETRLGPELDRGGYLYVPESYDAESPAPLFVGLHGGGGSATFWRRLYDECEERGMLLLSIDSRARTWDSIGQGFGPDVRFIDSALRYTFQRCAVDVARIALGGFSDGASYALSLGPSNGDLFTHLVAFSPGFSSPDDPIVGSPPVYVSHGSSDRVLPVRLSREGIVPMFEMDGYTIRYDEFDGGHTMTPEIVDAALDWFTT